MERNKIILVPKGVFLLPTPSFKPFKKDVMLYFIWLIIERTAFSQDFIKGYFLNISSRTLLKIAENYRQYIDFLIDQEVIDINDKYNAGSGVKFTKSYRLKRHGQLEPYILSDKVLLKKVYAKIDWKNTAKHLLNMDKKQFPTAYYSMNDWMVNSMTINLKEAIKGLNISNSIRANSSKETIQKYYQKVHSIYRFANGLGYITRSKKDNRIHTNISSFPKTCRKTLRLNGKYLVSFDLKSSQPFMSSLLFNPDCYRLTFKNKELAHLRDACFDSLSDKQKESIIKLLNEFNEDVTRYINIVTKKDIYEDFGRIIGEQNRSRDDLKKLFYSTLFSDSKKQKRRKRLFRKEYPTVWNVFEIIKDNNHKALSHILFKIESFIVLDRVVLYWLMDFGDSNPIFSLHDALVTIEPLSEELKIRMTKIVKSYVGYEPRLDREEWV